MQRDGMSRNRGRTVDAVARECQFSLLDALLPREFFRYRQSLQPAASYSIMRCVALSIYCFVFASFVGLYLYIASGSIHSTKVSTRDLSGHDGYSCNMLAKVTSQYQKSQEEAYVIVNVMETETKCLSQLAATQPCEYGLRYNETTVVEDFSKTLGQSQDVLTKQQRLRNYDRRRESAKSASRSDRAEGPSRHLLSSEEEFLLGGVAVDSVTGTLFTYNSYLSSDTYDDDSKPMYQYFVSSGTFSSILSKYNVGSAAAYDGNIYFYDTNNMELYIASATTVTSLLATQHTINALAYDTYTGDIHLVGSWGVMTYHVSTGTTTSYNVSTGVLTSVTADSKYIYYCSVASDEAQVLRINKETGDSSALIRDPAIWGVNYPISLAIDDETDNLYILDFLQSVHVHNMNTGVTEKVAVLEPYFCGPTSISIDQSTRILYVGQGQCSAETPNIVMYDLSTGAAQEFDERSAIAQWYICGDTIYTSIPDTIAELSYSCYQNGIKWSFEHGGYYTKSLLEETTLNHSNTACTQQVYDEICDTISNLPPYLCTKSVHPGVWNSLGVALANCSTLLIFLITCSGAVLFRCGRHTAPPHPSLTSFDARSTEKLLVIED